MQEIIHAHEIFSLVEESDELLTFAAFKERIVQKFGADARFTNCTKEEYSIDEIITFLVSRDKIRLTDFHVTLNKENICMDD